MAYHVPRFLELYWEWQIPDEEPFYARLLVAVRPELAKPIVPNLGEIMADDERQSLFGFFEAASEARLAEEITEDRAWVMTETVAFLAAVDTPLAPLLMRLKDSRQRQVRGNVCLFLAARFWEPWAFGNPYLKHLSLLPENQAALDAFVDPSAIAEYLVDHVEDTKAFTPERRQDAELAFDYAMQRAEVQNIPNLNPQQVQ